MTEAGIKLTLEQHVEKLIIKLNFSSGLDLLIINVCTCMSTLTSVARNQNFSFHVRS